MPKILIGLITHPNSTADPSLYREAINYFSLGFQEQKWEVVIEISRENSYSQRINLGDLWASKWANISLVYRWIHFVEKSYSPKISPFDNFRALAFIRRLKVIFMFALETIWDPHFKKLEEFRYRRNLNISLSHMKIINMSLIDSYDLTLILEDDALLSRDPSLRRDLIDFAINNLAKASQPALISLSDSLPTSKLFVTNSEGFLPTFSFSENIYLPKIMHHNTTCAVIYNQRYVEGISTVWEELSNRIIRRGVPIDWLINALVLFQPINSLFTFHSRKNLIVQGSLQSNQSDKV